MTEKILQNCGRGLYKFGFFAVQLFKMKIFHWALCDDFGPNCCKSQYYTKTYNLSCSLRWYYSIKQSWTNTRIRSLLVAHQKNVRSKIQSLDTRHQRRIVTSINLKNGRIKHSLVFRHLILPCNKNAKKRSVRKKKLKRKLNYTSTMVSQVKMQWQYSVRNNMSVTKDGNKLDVIPRRT